MDFALTEEQRLLAESVGQLLADHYDFAARRQALAGPEGWSRAMWRRFADLGMLGLPFAAEHGGSAGGAVETMLVMEAIGRALVVEPYLATVVLGGGLLRHAGSPTQRSAIIPGIATGERLLAFAHCERQSRWDLADIETRARREGSGYVLDGAKALVLGGDSADLLIVLARSAGAPTDGAGLGLFLVPASAPGVMRRGYALQDGRRAADIVLEAVRVGREDAMGDPEGALPAIEQVVEEAIAALCAEAVGAMEAALALTTEYLKTRRQFGTTIGSFQALQHRAVDMYIALEESRSMAILAAAAVADGDRAERAKVVAAAKVQIGRAGRLVGEQAVQLHGGIGMTMEHSIGHYFKRLAAIDLAFGDADHHTARLARMGSLLEER